MLTISVSIQNGNLCMKRKSPPLIGIIFGTAVILAVLAVILLATFSPGDHSNPSSKNPSKKPWLAMSLYIQQSHVISSGSRQVLPSDAGSDAGGAFIFHRTLTEGPENTSRVVGKAQGFIIPVEHFAHSNFNIIYLSFDSPDYSGSVSVEAKHFANREREELTVVGGTGSFAFARGLAIFAQTDQRPPDKDFTYHIELQLRFPNRSQTIPG